MSAFPPPPSGLSLALWREVQAALKGDGDPLDAARRLGEALHERPAEWLLSVLDALREGGGYAVSLPLIEAVWQAELPLSIRGRVAHDWLGTVTHGFGDAKEAQRLADRLGQDAAQFGPAFAADLGHLLVEFGHYEAAAAPLAFAVAEAPGDLAARFALGVVHKRAGRFAECRDCFLTVTRLEPHPAAFFNLALAATALGDWPLARQAWVSAGISLPPGSGDPASPGGLTPVRLKTPPGSPVSAEVIWGRALCPVRVRLESLPRFSVQATVGDVVLVDGAPEGEVHLNGATVPVLPFLARLSASGHRRCRVTPTSPARAAALVKALKAAGFPAADWTGLFDAAPAVGFACSATRDLSAARRVLHAVDPDATVEESP